MPLLSFTGSLGSRLGPLRFGSTRVHQGRCDIAHIRVAANRIGKGLHAGGIHLDERRVKLVPATGRRIQITVLHEHQTGAHVPLPFDKPEAAHVALLKKVSANVSRILTPMRPEPYCVFSSPSIISTTSSCAFTCRPK